MLLHFVVKTICVVRGGLSEKVWFQSTLNVPMVSINEVTLHQAWLVMGWETVSGVQLTVPQKSVSVYNQPLR